MFRRCFCLLLTLSLLLSLPFALAEEPTLDTLLHDIELAAEEEPKTLTVGPLSFDISEDRQSIFIDKPEVTGSDEYRIAYNIYDADSNPVNYFYSLEDRVAATPGYGGLFNVFVVVTDVTGAQNTQNIGWQTLSWPLADSLSVGRATFTLSEDRKSVYVDRPEIHCKSGSVSIAYNIYDDQSNPVNYFYSTEKRVAATPGYSGKFNVFIVVTDTVTGEQDVQNIGWQVLGDPEEEPEEPEEDDPADYEYYVYDDGVYITGYRGNKTRLVIPSVIEGKPVRWIGEQAFSNQTAIESVRLPSETEVIFSYAFSGCSGLKEVFLNDGLAYISQGVFQDCASLRQISLPASLEEIANNIFLGCTSLEAITMAEGNARYASLDGALLSSDLQCLYICPGGKTGAYAIPEGVTGIYYDAFFACRSLTSIILPVSLSFLDSPAYPFVNCTGLTEFSVAPGNPELASLDGVLFTKDGSTLIRYPGGKAGSYAIPAGVTSLYDAAFLNCQRLTDVTIPESVMGISTGAFVDCPSLTCFTVAQANSWYASVDGVLFSKDRKTLVAFPTGRSGVYDVPDGTAAIGEEAFECCEGLQEVTLPESLTAIGSWAFMGCIDLRNVTIPSGVTILDYYIFSGCTGLEYAVIPAGVTEIRYMAFGECTAMTEFRYRGTAEEWEQIQIDSDAFPTGMGVVYGYDGP